MKSLQARRSPLASPVAQRALLSTVDLDGGEFDARLTTAGLEPIRARRLRVFQINLGKLCNMTCAHCHVDAGPDRTRENMDAATAALCIEAIECLQPEVVDLTGGAPELNPSFRQIVARSAVMGAHVIDRCNLSVLLLPKNKDLPKFLGEHGVEVVASLPDPSAERTDAQRGENAFSRSIEGLRRLNAAGYGQGDPTRRLTLMHNPSDLRLASEQVGLECAWRASLMREHAVTFDRLVALNNMPISRFLEWLDETGNLGPYLQRLADRFNPATLPGLMCTDTVSIGWDGRLYDCDFNQMLDLPADIPALHVRDLTRAAWTGHRVRTGRHCFGCTAAAGSSCGGATVQVAGESDCATTPSL